jgi:chitin disaccharide deacetylase
MKEIIINADDLGLTSGVTRGIIEAYLKGIVTSTSAQMNSPYSAESLAEVWQHAPDLGVGVHMVLTRGKPLLPADEVSTLVDDQGNFYKFQQFASRITELNLNEVCAEWRAQIEAFIAKGRRPDHLDSHHHSSYASLGLFEVMLELAREYNVPIRCPVNPMGNMPVDGSFMRILNQSPVNSPQACITSFYGDEVSTENLVEIISSLPADVSELMCHPGYADRESMESSSYNTSRELELQVLVSPEIKTAVEDNGIKLCRFSDL